MLLFELCHFNLWKKIYNYLPVISFKERARALDFPLPPAPFSFFICAPCFFIFWILFLRCFLALYRTKKSGVSLSLGLVNIMCCILCPALCICSNMFNTMSWGFYSLGGFVFDGFCYVVGLLFWFLLELFLLYLYSAFIFWGVFYFAFFHIFLIFFDFVFLFLVVFWFFFHIFSSVLNWSYSIF